MSIKNTNSRFLTLVIVAVFCGLAAGVLGELITRVYFLKDFSFPYLNSELNLADWNNNRSNLIIRDAKKVVVNQDLKVAETLNSLRPTLVGVFKALPNSTNNPVPNYYKLAEPALVGVVITADGWAVSPLKEEMKKDFKTKDYLVITSDRKIYQIDKIVSLENLPGNLVLFHLSGAANLPVKKIVAPTDLAIGTSLLAINGLEEARPVNLAYFTRQSTVLSSDSINIRLGLTGDYANLKNTFVFNLAGDLAAFIGSDQEIIPAFSFSSDWQNVFNKKVVTRPYLGVNYLDLSKIKTSATTLEKGVLLYPTATEPAVLKNSPAAAAGLKAGDIITWVDNQEINNVTDLASLITNYQSGETITLTYLRAEIEKEVAVKLGELK